LIQRNHKRHWIYHFGWSRWNPQWQYGLRRSSRPLAALFRILHTTFPLISDQLPAKP